MSDYPICAARDEPEGPPGYDLLWEAIPLYVLLDEAVAHSKECAFRTVPEIRCCAKQAIRLRVCHCCTSEKSIMDSIVDEFMRRLLEADSKILK